jgi:energy-coupling factor transporter ATP-binding protein EcfA2
LTRRGADHEASGKIVDHLARNALKIHCDAIAQGDVDCPAMQLDATHLGKWFQDRPFWIQEAVRRLFTKDNLTPEDFEQLAELCQQQVADPKSAHEPVSLPAFALPRSAVGVSLRLCAISEVKGIEGLNPRAPLTFTQEQLTIFYGGTGVGKSSYVRILNNVCGSKNRRKLLGNVFRADTVKSCKIGYAFGGESKEIAWQPPHGLQDELAALEIYDSECGQVYVNAENEVTFEPWLLGLFQRLVDASAAVDRILEAKITALPSQKPAMPVELAATPAATWYGQLSARTTAIEVTQWSDWSPTREQELDSLHARLIEKNPAEQTRQLRTRKVALEKFLADLVAIHDGLSGTVVNNLLNRKIDAAAKRKAASEDATKVFGGAPLNGVGSQSWKLLWEQARVYSEKVVYVGKPFPFTEEGAQCVLCQQTLDDNAKVRFLSFEKFVKGELESLANKAEADVAELLEKLPGISTADDFTTRLATLGLDDEALTRKLYQFRDGAQATHDALLTAKSQEEVPSVPSTGLIDGLSPLIASLETKAKSFDEDAKKTDKADLQKKARELEARKWLSEQKASLEAEITRLKKVSALDAARKLTDTTALSKKKSDLAQVLVSEAFIRRFESELKVLGAARIQVELVQTRTDKGHVFHRIRLKNAKIVVPTADVLSEGERRAVSLAAFLADVEGNESNAPIVFDDPISSLDQDFEETVVARLIALAKKRQVIVFTHRLSTLTLLEEAAEPAGVATRVVALSREPWGAGEPGETPFSTRKPDKVINGLKDRLTRARKILTDNGKAEYDLYAKGICTDVRILIERLVEDTLLNNVVRRFRRAVHTQNKIGGLAKIKPEDCQLIDEFMTKYSRYEHSQPSEAPVPLPEPDEIATDLTRLQQWLKAFSERETPHVGRAVVSPVTAAAPLHVVPRKSSTNLKSDSKS